ncbi:MAG: type transport system ATP-binding protein [Candidatus Eremiobacteraeota bacterium]|nr:type transport system ATP-binding protein [Candidatus Eremiobacteraeota bacterium]
MLRFSGVSVAYGRKLALEGVDLDLGRGLHVVLGPNGAGKTTLFRVGAGILTPTRGYVSVRGTPIAADVRAKSVLGYVSHRSGLQPRLTVRDNLEFWSRVLGQSPSARHDALDRVRRQLDLDDLLPSRFGTLSRGQQQRVSLARALMSDPELLFLDEPTTGLDPVAAKKLRRQLMDFVADGKTIVYTTHNLYEAEELATDVILLKDGRVLAQGTLDEIAASFRARDRHAFVLEGEPLDVFQRLGLSASFDDRAWLVDDLRGLETSRIVAALVGEGIRVKEVRGVGHSLEAIYEELER